MGGLGQPILKIFFSIFTTVQSLFLTTVQMQPLPPRIRRFWVLNFGDFPERKGWWHGWMTGLLAGQMAGCGGVMGRGGAVMASDVLVCPPCFPFLFNGLNTKKLMRR